MHAEAGYVRPLGKWTCLMIEGGRNNEYCYAMDSKGRDRHLKRDTLEPYPDFVRSNADFVGGFAYEIFEIVDPWETLQGKPGEEFLRVRRTEGKIDPRHNDGYVKLPTSIAEPSEKPVYLRSDPAAV